MKIIFTCILALLLVSNLSSGQDSLYIYKEGVVAKMRALADIDSIIFNRSGKPGSDIVFNPNLSYGSITDIDNNIYKTIQIGTQIWMAENLKTSQLNDGTAFPFVKNAIEWSNLSTPGYCWYDNDSSRYNGTYGKLYNWYAVNTGKLCPAGWHVPTDAEWTVLSDYLGGEEIAGDKLKEVGLAHWDDPNTGVSNETGFTALPGGGNEGGDFKDLGSFGDWWSSTRVDNNYAWLRFLADDYSGFIRLSHDMPGFGVSVRCLRDE